MADSIVTGYTYACAAKQITITQAEFTNITLEEIKSIFNASTGDWLYNSEIGKNGIKRSNWYMFYPLASVSSGVITYTAPTPKDATNNDKLIITLFNNISLGNIEYFFNNVTIAANSAEVISDPIFTGNSSLAWYWISQTASTNLTVNIYAESSATSTDRGLIKPYALGMAVLSITEYIEKCPPYIRVGITNGDIENPTSVTVKMRRTK